LNQELGVGGEALVRLLFLQQEQRPSLQQPLEQQPLQVPSPQQQPLQAQPSLL
jgi:hypothetical protein